MFLYEQVPSLLLVLPLCFNRFNSQKYNTRLTVTKVTNSVYYDNNVWYLWKHAILTIFFLLALNLNIEQPNKYFSFEILDHRRQHVSNIIFVCLPPPQTYHDTHPAHHRYPTIETEESSGTRYSFS
jgi:hypothetical protein